MAAGLRRGPFYQVEGIGNPLGNNNNNNTEEGEGGGGGGEGRCVMADRSRGTSLTITNEMRFNNITHTHTDAHTQTHRDTLTARTDGRTDRQTDTRASFDSSGRLRLFFPVAENVDRDNNNKDPLS